MLLVGVTEYPLKSVSTATPGEIPRYVCLDNGRAKKFPNFNISFLFTLGNFLSVSLSKVAYRGFIAASLRALLDVTLLFYFLLALVTSLLQTAGLPVELEVRPSTQVTTGGG